MTAMDDGQLARRVARGDRRAAEELINRHQPAVRLFLRRLTGRDDLADDLAQETFVRVLENAHRYDPQYPMRTWLFTMARRLTINRARKSDSKVVSTEFEGMRSGEADPADLAAQRDQAADLKARLNTALARLSEAQRCALVLVHQQGLSVEEAAAAMQMPVGTIKSHLHRGREVMRKLLSPELEPTT